MNHTDAHGTGDHRRIVEALSGQDDPTQYDHQTSPVTSRVDHGSIAMNGLIHEELARQRHREAYLEARQARLWRAVRAQRRARRAAEVAVRAAERVGADGGYRPSVRAGLGAPIADR
jgi:hypothetical protein